MEFLTTVLNEGVVDEIYSDTLKLIGGIKPYTYSLYNSELPNGFSLDENSGKIQGMPENQGVFHFQVKGMDSYTPRHELIEDFFITINPKGSIILSDTLREAWYDSLYLDTLEFSGGTAP